MARPAVELSPWPRAESGGGGIPGSVTSSKGREEEEKEVVGDENQDEETNEDTDLEEQPPDGWESAAEGARGTLQRVVMRERRQRRASTLQGDYENRSLAGYVKERARDARTPGPLRKAPRESEQPPEVLVHPPRPLRDTAATTALARAAAAAAAAAMASGRPSKPSPRPEAPIVHQLLLPLVPATPPQQYYHHQPPQHQQPQHQQPQHQQPQLQSHEGGARVSQSSATPINREMEKSEGLRNGAWTAEEEEYAGAIIHHVSWRSLPTPIPEGMSLCAFLAEKLSCKPSRVSSKFPGIGRIDRKAKLERDKVERELGELEERFRAGLASASESAAVSYSSSWAVLPRPSRQAVPDGVDSAESGGEAKAGQELLQGEMGLLRDSTEGAKDQAGEMKAPLSREVLVEQSTESEEKTESAAPLDRAGGAGVDGGTLCIGDEMELPNERWKKIDDHFPADSDGDEQENAVGATSRGVVVTAHFENVRLLPLYAIDTEYLGGGKPSSGDAEVIRGFLEEVYLDAYDAFGGASETLPREWAALARRVVMAKRKGPEGGEALKAIRRIEGPSYL